MTLKALKDVTFERTSDLLLLTSPLATLSLPTDNSIMNIKTMNEMFLSKTTPFSSLSVVNDNILNIVSSSIELVDPTMQEGYSGTARAFSDLIPLLYGVNGGRVTLDEMNNTSSAESGVLPSLYISSPQLQESPINKGYLESLALDYVTLLNPSFNNTVVSQTREYSENSVMSIGDARRHVSAFFDSLTTNSIGSITEFKRYIDGVCATDYSGFMDYTFSVEGGKIYNGFDYDSKYSILNSQALRNLLIEQTGQYTRNMPIVYSAVLYFPDITKINELSAYAQKLGYPFDISQDTIAQVFLQLKKVVGKLCVMSPDVIPDDEDPVVPEFKASAFFAPPSLFSSFSPWIGRSMLIKPTYFSQIDIYMSSPPSIGSFLSGIVTSVYLNKPIYIPPVEDGTDMTIPQIGVFNQSMSIKTITSPENLNMRGAMSLFKKEDEYEPYISVFATSDNCSNRYRMDSYRQINMMEVAIVASSLVAHSLTSKYYFYSDSEDFVLLKSQYLTMILSDIFCKISDRIKMRMTVDINRLIDILDEAVGGGGDTSNLSTCTSNLSGSMAVSTLNPASSRVIVTVNGQEINSEGVVSGTQSLLLTEILGTINTSNVQFGWNARYGSQGYNTNIDSIVETLVQLISEYEEGKIYTSSSPVIENNITVSSLSSIAKGFLLSEYIEGISSQLGGTRKSATKEKYGIFSDSESIPPTELKSYAAPYSNVLVGSYGSTPLVNRRDNVENPSPGQNEVKVWKPLYAAYNSNMNSLPYLGLSDDTEAVFTLYGPMVLLYKDSGILYYDPIGVDVVVSTEIVNGELYYVMVAIESRIVLHKTAEGGSPIERLFTRDYCDEWESPFTSFGQISLGAGTLSPLISQGGQERQSMISNVATSIIHRGGCDAVDEFEGSSGISTTNINNISDLASLDPNSPEQEEGEVPGAYTFSLKMKATKYTPFMSGGGELVNRVESTNFTICVTLGVIDGAMNEGGDILAQGYTQEEVPQSGITPVVYLAPHPLIKPYMTLERITVGEYEASKYTIDIATFVSSQLMDDSSSELFVRFFDISDDTWKNAEVKITSLSENQEEATPFRTVLVGDIRSPGGVFSYKHAGQDPSHPIITGYSGSTEVDFIHGTRLVGTTFTPVPTATYTESDSADSFIPSVDLTVNTVHFFINNETIEVVLRDTKAVFSENRTIKIVME
jgi:hypothetical protein